MSTHLGDTVRNTDIDVDVAIIGAGTAGLSALKEIKRAGKTYVLIDHGPLGTSCARVGCMPSKAVLHAGGLWQGQAFIGGGVRQMLDVTGPDDLWRAARSTRDALASGAATRTVAAAGERLLMGQARFIAPDAVTVGGRTVRAKAFVIATGSTPIVPAFLRDIQARILTTDSLFELETLPRAVGILGVGAIGLEIGLALSRLGVRIVAGDLKSMPAGITDPEIGARAVQHFKHAKGLTMWLGQPINVTRTAVGIGISNGVATEQVDWILAALGRKPALDSLHLEAAGVALDEHGQPQIDPATLRAGQSALYFAGDVTADRPLQHEAADGGMIAGFNAARHGAAIRFQRRVSLSIVFSDPDIAFVGMPFDQLDPEHIIIGSASGQSNGRSRVMGAEDNLVRIYADRINGNLLGASIFAVHGEHIAHLLAWAIQRDETAESLLEMPFYHPTIEEMVQSALSDIVAQQGVRRTEPLGVRHLDREDLNRSTNNSDHNIWNRHPNRYAS
jgi:dihydrolipoamide dehydrogenase